MRGCWGQVSANSLQRGTSPFNLNQRYMADSLKSSAIPDRPEIKMILQQLRTRHPQLNLPGLA